MEQRINIAELLKDCPKGMELDCMMFDDAKFINIEEDDKPICIRTGDTYRYLTKFGTWTFDDNAKCVIFPKGKRTWEGFVPPIQFKDGDVIANNAYIAIFHKLDKIPNGVRNDVVYYHCLYRKENGYSKFKIDFGIGYESNFRFATDDEKQILFNVIKANGYKWNTESKTLEKLTKPEFKVGDEIVPRNSISNSWIVNSGSSEYYGLKLPNGSENIGVLPIEEQDDWELVPDKFDINTLKPFDNCKYSLDNGRTWKFAQYWYIMDNYKIDDIKIELWQD